MPTDPAVEALAAAIDPDVWDESKPKSKQPVAVIQWAVRRKWATDAAEAALDHIAANLHADTPEGAALRERLGLDRGDDGLTDAERQESADRYGRTAGSPRRKP